MKHYLKFVIPGKPIAKKRPKFARRGKFVTTYNEQESEESKFMIQLMNQLPAGFKPFEKGIPVFLDCVFYMPIPQASKKKTAQMISGEIMHTKKPDADNLLKFVKDCSNQIIYHDDSQVVYVRARKIYGEEPRTLFFVNVLSKLI